jgi:SnoaL-like domain
VTRDDLSAWVESYERAWRTPGTELLSELFAADAIYTPWPFRPSHHGLDAIRAFWEKGRDGPDEEFTIEWEIVAVDGDVGVVRSEVQYADPPQLWRNLWVVRFDDEGRCAEFEEWPFMPRR